jgi:nucleoside-diphosphate-sugar epimerase
MKQNKPRFSLITLHPSFVMGPSLIRKSAADIDGINALFWGSLQAKAPQFPTLLTDVRDVADAHLRATRAPTEGIILEFLLSGHATS